LEEAVAALRSALEERTRQRVPQLWAKAQKCLGIALLALGERESGTARTARLEEAVAALRSALEERTRQRVPLDEWVETRNDLANALSILGNALYARGEHKSGTARLVEAVKECRLTLEEVFAAIRIKSAVTTTTTSGQQ
jgi:hypothetical protein